jgi:hypothetical protein
MPAAVERESWGKNAENGNRNTLTNNLANCFSPFRTTHTHTHHTHHTHDNMLLLPVLLSNIIAHLMINLRDIG